MTQMLTRLAREDAGQDLAEYALLTAFIGLAGLAVWVATRTSLGARYVAMDLAEQNLWDWVPPSP